MAGKSPVIIGVPEKFFSPHGNDFMANQRQNMWQCTNSPDTKYLPVYLPYTKYVPQPHPIPASLCFPWANLPTRSQTGCLPYICALLTFGKWGGIKPPSKWRRLRAVNSWIQLSNSRNCLRSMTTLHIRLFTGKLQEHPISAIPPLAIQWSSRYTVLENI